MKSTASFVVLLLLSTAVCAQQPPHTKKLFRTTYQSDLFKTTPILDEGIGVTYLETEITLWDVDDNNTTHIQWDYKTVIKVEGPYKNGKRNGVFTYYVIDSLNKNKLYKIYEQHFVNDSLDGVWTTYNLKGIKVQEQTYVNGLLKGMATTYNYDGKAILYAIDHIDGNRKYIERNFYKSGTVESEITIEDKKKNGDYKEYFPDGKLKRKLFLKNNVLEGPASIYYESGVLKEEVSFSNNKFNGTRKYYHPNGQLWIEEIYKDGMHWTVIANYDAKGNKRNPGTLKEGNGTLILYKEDGTVRETVHYVNGVEQ